MTVLADIMHGAMVQVVVPGQSVQIVSAEWICDQAFNQEHRDCLSMIPARTTTSRGKR